MKKYCCKMPFKAFEFNTRFDGIRRVLFLELYEVGTSDALLDFS